MSQKVWGGRFQKDLDDTVDRFNASLRFDFRLYPQEIEGSKAHVRMLAKQRIISAEEASRMLAALAEINPATLLAGISGNRLTYHVLPTIAAADSGVSRIEITVPSVLTVYSNR